MNEAKLLMTGLLALGLTFPACGGPAAQAQPSAKPGAASGASTMRGPSTGGAGRAGSTRSAKPDFSGLRSRAACASMEMAIALGEKVSKSERKECEGRKATTKVTTKVTRRVAPTPKQAEVLKAPPTKKQRTE